MYPLKTYDQIPGGVTYQLCETLGRRICAHYRIHSGTLSIVNSANQGGILILDLEVRAEGGKYCCHALIANRYTRPEIRDDYRAVKLPSHICHRPRVEWFYPMAA